MDKARVDGIDGLAPAIAIDQKNSGRSPRSTVATITEIYDYLRLLYARIGHPHCPTCGTALEGYTPTRLARVLAQAREGERLVLTAPLYRPGSTRGAMLDDPAHLPQLAEALQAEGFTRIVLGTETVELAAWLARPKAQQAVPADTAVDLVVDRLRVQGRQRKRLAEAVELAFAKGHGLARLRFPDGAEPADGDDTVQTTPGAIGGGDRNGGGTDDGAESVEPAHLPAQGRFARNEVLVSAPVGCVDCDYYLDEPFAPRMFSFNSHVGACEACAGLGKSQQVDPALLVPFPDRPLLEGALVAGKLGRALARKNWKAERTIRAFATREGIDLARPFGQLSRREQTLLLHGDGQALSVRRRWGGTRSVEFRGLIGIALDWYRDPQLAGFAQHIEPVMADVACPACQGERLKPAYRAVTIDGLNISQFCAFTVEEALAATARWRLSANEALVAQQPRQKIRARRGFLKDVGLGYLNLRREATTLSGGEAQRIRLASQLGSHLVGVLYVLDEP
ncbi:MAG TPA: hypothetical protein VGC20_10450, partial [bacterium]